MTDTAVETRPRSNAVTSPTDGRASPVTPPSPAPAARPAKSSKKVDKLFSIIGKGPADEVAVQQHAVRKQRKQEDKKKREENKKQASAGKAQIVYQDRFDRMQSAMQDLLEYGSAADKYLGAMMESIQAAADVLSTDPDGYDAAYKALHSKKFSLSKVREQAKKDHDAAENAARKTSPGLFTLHGQIETQVKDAWLIQARRSAIVAQARSLLDPAIAPGAKPGDIQAAETALKKLQGEMTAEITAAVTKRGEVAAKIQQAEGLMDRAAALLSSTEAAPMNALLINARSNCDDYDYAAAEAAVDVVLSEVETACAAQQPFFDRWAGEQKNIVGLKDRIKAQQARLEKGEHLRMADAHKQLRDLSDGLDALATHFPAGKPRVDDELSYKDAVDTVTATRADVDTLEQQIDLYKEFVGEKTKVRKEIRGLFEDARALLGPLETAVTALDPQVKPQTVSAPFAEQLDTAQAAWRERWPNAYNAASLDAEGTRTRIAKIGADIRAATTADAASGIVDETRIRVAADACALAMANAKRAVDDLVSLDLDEAAKPVSRLDVLQKRVAKCASEASYTQCSEEAATLAEETGATAVLMRARVKVAQDQLTVQVNAVAATLDGFWEAVKGLSDNKRRDAYTKLHDTLRTALNGHKAVAGLQQLSLLEESLAEIRILDHNVTDTAAEFDRSPKDTVLSVVSGGVLGKGLNTATLEDVQRKVAAQKKRLQSRELRAFAGETGFALEQRLDAVLDAVGSDTMAELVKRIATIADEVGKAAEAAAAERERYNAFKEQLEGTAKLLEGEKFGYAPLAQKALQAQLKEIRAVARQQGGLKEAAPRYHALLRQVDEALKGPVDEGGVPVVLADGERDLKAAEELREKQKSRWAGNVVVLEKTLDALPSAVSAEKKALKDRLKAAGDAFRKTGDYDAAWAQFSAIRERARLVGENPGGLLMHGRGQLPAVRQRWANAVGELKGRLDAVVTALKAVTDDPALTDDIKGLVTRELGAVKGQFNAVAFDKPVAVIVHPNSVDTARAAAREEALREVRRVRAMLRDDQRLQTLSQDTLLGTRLGGEISKVSLALADMETNLLISL